MTAQKPSTATKRARLLHWRLRRNHSIALAIVVACLGLILGGLTYLRAVYAETVLPRVTIGQHSFAGASRATVEQDITSYVDQLSETGILYIHETEEIAITPQVTATTDPDLSYPLMNIDVTETTDAMLAFGHGGSWWHDISDLIRALLVGRQFSPVMEIDEKLLTETLQENFADFDQPASNPKPTIQADGGLTVAAEHSGQTLDYSSAIETTREKLAALELGTITLTLRADEPELSLVETSDAQDQLRVIVATLPWTLSDGEKRWELDLATVSEWFVFTQMDGGAVLDFDEALVTTYLETSVVPTVNVEAQEGKFSVSNGRVSEFQASHPGRRLDLNATIDLMRDQLLHTTSQTAALVITETQPTSQADNINALGIKELVGTGRTNFKGSPKNRVHNLTVGANALNGILIKPGEEFSLVSALVPIDASTGYLPELVIKGNRTIPEYGGGLCQIGTTFFRAVLNAGLPIVERKNHSYRVSYYEPPVGMDATIYDPKPDFRFKNDYAASLLIQTRIEGTELIFDIYSTKDGREATTTEPRVFNIVKPGPTKYIETTDLKPGETNCTEKAHNGADAEFTYTVKYADGRVAEEVFKSHYKVWPAVCLVGKKPDAPKPAEPTNTNTNTNSAPVNTNTTPTNTNTAPVNTNTNAVPANTNTEPPVNTNGATE